MPLEIFGRTEESKTEAKGKYSDRIFIEMILY
jgi:hypothetical protein